MKSNKVSLVQTEVGSVKVTNSFRESAISYEKEIKQLKSTIEEKNKREKELVKRIDQLETENRKLQKDAKDYGIEALKSLIEKGKHKDMNDYVNHLMSKALS